MTMHKQGGFTIIEVVLFLAITGGLFAALMIGVNTNITQQRYLDSVRSYKALIQSQYAAVLDTRNENTQKGNCNDSTGTLSEGDDRINWGASHCVILGRAIVIRGSTNGGDRKTVETSSVIAPDKGDDREAQNADDKKIFTDFYKPYRAEFDQETVTLDWDSELTDTNPDKKTESTIIILILRSPVTGLIQTFAVPSGDPLNLVDVINNSVSELKNCIYNESGSLQPTQLVTIKTGIAGADAVALDGSSNSECNP